ncbi:hypothetical protein BD769DRAFT_282555 [Suillus cothurnatus]|nr:hypothetical protein BD769DRAFT_282555 [Suillus cothurnatus]
MTLVQCVAKTLITCVISSCGLGNSQAIRLVSDRSASYSVTDVWEAKRLCHVRKLLIQSDPGFCGKKSHHRCVH